MIDVKVLNESGFPLKYATDGAIGLDLYALQDQYLRPRDRWAFDTGISIELPENMGAFVLPRSGIAYKRGLVCVTGVIDRDYRGRIAVNLINQGHEDCQVKKGERIAQLVFIYAPQARVSEVAALTDTVRGSGGFGSTGN